MAGVRRTWDKEYFAAKAKERVERGGDELSQPVGKAPKPEELKEEFRPAEKDAEGPMGSERAFLNVRREKLDLDSKTGKIEIVKAGEANSAAGPGYWCEVCQCLQKDSVSYLDHINGKKHQRALGYSMRVERVGADKVKERLEQLKRKVSEQSSSNAAPQKSAVEEYEERLAERELEKEKLKKKRKEDELSKKVEKESIEMESTDPEIASLMGFAGFGNKKK